MANQTPKRPIGFGRKNADPDPNGTGDGFTWQPAAAPAEEHQEPPARQALGTPLPIDDLVAQQILEAYNLYPLAPLSKFEYQLLEIIAGLEKQFGPQPEEE
jgi:hypothetical protein